jgi:hypothetical protein
MARRRRSLLGNKKSTVSGSPPKFGGLKSPIAEPVQPSEVEPEESTSQVEPELAAAVEELVEPAPAILEEGLKPQDTAPTARELVVDAEPQDDYSIEEASLSNDVPVADVTAADVTADDELGIQGDDEDTFSFGFPETGDLPLETPLTIEESPEESETFDFGFETEGGLPELTVDSTADVIEVEDEQSVDEQDSDRIFDPSDLPSTTPFSEPDSFESQAVADLMEEELESFDSDTLDDIFQFDDVTDVPEDPAALLEEATASLSTDTDTADSLFFESDLFMKTESEDDERFEDDDFSELHRDVTDVPEDPAFVESVLKKYGIQELGDTIVPQDREVLDDSDFDADAFSTMERIPEDDVTAQFKREESFGFGFEESEPIGSTLPPVAADSTNNDDFMAVTETDTPFVEEGEGNGPTESGAAAEFPVMFEEIDGISDFGGFGDDVPPTEEVPSAVLEDLASPHYASMSVPDAPDLSSFGNIQAERVDDEDLEEPPVRKDYTMLIAGAIAVIVGLILWVLVLS